MIRMTIGLLKAARMILPDHPSEGDRLTIPLDVLRSKLEPEVGGIAGQSVTIEFNAKKVGFGEVRWVYAGEVVL